MKVHYDPEVDAVYIQLGNQKPDGVVEISEGVNLDTTSENKIVGIEILCPGNAYLHTKLYVPRIMIAFPLRALRLRVRKSLSSLPKPPPIPNLSEVLQFLGYRPDV